MKEPGSVPYDGINLTKARPALEYGDHYLFLAPNNTRSEKVGDIIEHLGVRMRFVEQHRCGAQEFVVLGPVDNPT